MCGIKKESNTITGVQCWISGSRFKIRCLHYQQCNSVTQLHHLFFTNVVVLSKTCQSQPLGYSEKPGYDSNWGSYSGAL